MDIHGTFLSTGGSPAVLRRQLGAASIAVLLGLAAVAAHTAAGDDPFAFLGSATMIAAAAFAIGALVGFLFGIPRSRVDRYSANQDDLERAAYGANTNLEQISDWLTKILVGVGLTQFGAIGATGGHLFDRIGPAVGGGASSDVFAGALVIYFSAVGFVLGWLLTRMFLGPALSQVDRRALEGFLAAEDAELMGDSDRAARLRQRALTTLRHARRLARRYERIRDQPASPSRTVEMEQLITMARLSSAAGTWTNDQVRALFAEGSAGSRIFALGLMEGDAGLADFESALDAIAASRSAFEQYHGLRAMRAVIERTSTEQRIRLRQVLHAQTGPGGHLKPGTRRLSLAKDLLRVTAPPDDVAPPPVPAIDQTSS